MSERVNRGCLYWDESSRGYHGNASRTPYHRGRWVGERIENGKRVRMRSSDYDKVLAWVNGEKREPRGVRLRDFPNYTVDVDARQVFNRWGRMMKGYLTHGLLMYRLHRDGVRYATSWNRIAYAALHDIEVRKIPSDIVVTCHDGEYVLQYLGDFMCQEQHRRSIRKRKVIEISLSKRKREIEILQRFYRSHDATEVVNYATHEVFDRIVSNVMYNRRCTLERARDVTLEATEKFLRRITDDDKPVTSITSYIISLCSQCLKMSYRQRPYDDNVKTAKIY